MSNAKTKTLLSTTIGTLMASALSVSVAQADVNPFGATELTSGYMVVAEGSCGEGKCGGDAKNHKTSEGSCGEGKCGADKKHADKNAEGACGGNKHVNKSTEGSCGEGKCGADKRANKSTEGACGEGKCGGQG